MKPARLDDLLMPLRLLNRARSKRDMPGLGVSAPNRGGAFTVPQHRTARVSKRIGAVVHTRFIGKCEALDSLTLVLSTNVFPERRRVSASRVRQVSRPLLSLVLLALLAAHFVLARQIPELDSESDLVKRSQRALSMAEAYFEDARQAYTANEIKKGDAFLEDMTKALNVCVASLNAAHKSRLYKPAEMRVVTLSRRLHTLVGDISVDDRGWAEYTEHQVEAVHEKLLLGVMKK